MDGMIQPRAPLALIIEDEPLASRVLQRVLETLGVSSAVAADAGEARLSLKERSFDVILIDLRLPGQEGPGLIEEIQSDARLAARSIVVTAFPMVANMFTHLPIIDKDHLHEITGHVERILKGTTRGTDDGDFLN
jgi:CheY-like chemotaxis protein